MPRTSFDAKVFSHGVRLVRRILAVNSAGIIVIVLFGAVGTFASFLSERLGEVLITVTAVFFLGILKFFAFDARRIRLPASVTPVAA